MKRYIGTSGFVGSDPPCLAVRKPLLGLTEEGIWCEEAALAPAPTVGFLQEKNNVVVFSIDFTAISV